MKILIVEDNSIQVEWMNDVLTRRFPDAKIQECDTEYGFHAAFENIAADPPDVVLMDVMLNWTHPAPDMVHPPPAIVEAGIWRAGIRCQKMLRGDPRTRDIPIVLYTSLAESSLTAELKELPPAAYLPKDSNFEPLVREIQSTLKKK
jgi:CheY-like chemotaxis protein